MITSFLDAHAVRVRAGPPATFSSSTTPRRIRVCCKEEFEPPIPLEVLGEARGRLYTPDELERKFARALFPRTTNRYGCVTLHRYHFYVEAGLPKTQVLLWVYGNALRAVCDNVVLAEYHCRYDHRDGKVTDIRDGSFPPTRFVSSQGALLPRTSPRGFGTISPKAREASSAAAISCPAIMAL